MTDVRGPSSAHWIPDPQVYAINQMADSHEQAIYSFGEYAIFLLRWSIDDHEAGLVERCHRCFANPMFDTYKQSQDARCLSCWGTTFEGGIKARLVRPSIWVYGEDDHITAEQRASRGEVVLNNNAQVQVPSQFLLHHGDFIIKADNSRWQVKGANPSRLQTGFQVNESPTQSLGFIHNQVAREDESSVAYLIPPASGEDVRALLDIPYVRTPQDFSDAEFVNGPIL